MKNKITITENPNGTFHVRVQRFGADLEGDRPNFERAIKCAQDTWAKIDRESPILYASGVRLERVWKVQP